MSLLGLLGILAIASHVFAQQSPAAPGRSIAWTASASPTALVAQAASASQAAPGAQAAAPFQAAPGAQAAPPLQPSSVPPAPVVPAAPGPSLQQALEAAQTAIATCQGLEQPVAVTVLDSGGVPKVVLASDGVSPRGVQSSTNKALTALTFKAATSELGERSKSDAGLAERLAGNPSYNTRAGGILVLRGSDVLGAIGVGGARGSEKDEACAKAALTRLQVSAT
jgi:uncharacterized protein GlcG (DUF336 family)